MVYERNEIVFKLYIITGVITTLIIALINKLLQPTIKTYFITKEIRILVVYSSVSFISDIKLLYIPKRMNCFTRLGEH